MKGLYPLISLILALLAGCSSTPVRGSLPSRTGPSFSTAFPDPRVLVQTGDVPGTRELLGTTRLPEDPQHHAELIQLLEGTEQLTTQHLLLLTEAVHQDEAQGKQVYFRTSTQGFERWMRSAGPYAPTIDQLLISGLSRVTDPGPQNLGRLLARTQTSGALRQLLATTSTLENGALWNDGSEEDYRHMLSACQVDIIRRDLCLAALDLEQVKGNTADGLRTIDPERRVDLTLLGMDFDEGRLELLGEIYGQRNRIPGQTLQAHVASMRFDAGRVRAAQLAANKLPALSAEQALELVGHADYDEGRLGLVAAMAPRLPRLTPEEALALARCASFDTGRQAVIQALLDHDALPLETEHLTEYVNLASFDSGRIGMLRLLQAHLPTPLDAQSLEDLLGTVTFDSARDEILEIFRGDLQELGRKERERLLGINGRRLAPLERAWTRSS